MGQVSPESFIRPRVGSGCSFAVAAISFQGFCAMYDRLERFEIAVLQSHFHLEIKSGIMEYSIANLYSGL